MTKRQRPRYLITVGRASEILNVSETYVIELVKTNSLTPEVGDDNELMLYEDEVFDLKLENRRQCDDMLQEMHDLSREMFDTWGE